MEHRKEKEKRQNLQTRLSLSFELPPTPSFSTAIVKLSFFCELYQPHANSPVHVASRESQAYLAMTGVAGYGL